MGSKESSEQHDGLTDCNSNGQNKSNIASLRQKIDSIVTQIINYYEIINLRGEKHD